MSDICFFVYCLGILLYSVKLFLRCTVTITNENRQSAELLHNSHQSTHHEIGTNQTESLCMQVIIPESEPIKNDICYRLDLQCIECTGPAEGEGAAGASAPHFFGNFKELLRKRCFPPPPPPHFQSSSAGPDAW